ncbi:DUF1657 domain-containing protein [Bacillota bacterium Lsc_1132]
MTIASSVKQLLSTTKGIKSQLSSLALNSLDEEAKRVFHETMLTVEEIQDDLQARSDQLERLEPQYKGS